MVYLLSSFSFDLFVVLNLKCVSYGQYSWINFFNAFCQSLLFLSFAIVFFHDLDIFKNTSQLFCKMVPNLGLMIPHDRIHVMDFGQGDHRRDAELYSCVTLGGTCCQLVPLLVMSHLIFWLKSYLPK